MRTFIAALALVVLFAALGGMSLPSRAANGDLDRSFGGYGTNGRVIGDPFPGTFIANMVALPDDKLLVVGSNGQDFVVARYDGSGVLDGGFGTNGVTTLDFNNHADFATAVALSFDGKKILVAGTTSFGTRALPNSDFALARLNTDGTLSLFRTGSTPSRLTDIIRLRDNTLVASGEAGGDLGLLAFKNDLSPVSDFGTNGMATVDFGGDDIPHALYQLSDGTFFVAGESGRRLAMAHLTAKGQLVPNSAVTADFADTGAEAVRALALTLVPEVRLLTIGTITEGGSPRLVMMRHFLDGTADHGGRQPTDFGADPTFGFHSNDRAQASLFQPDGKLIVAGSTRPSGGQESAALVRYTAAGALDPSFDGDGRLTLTTIPEGAADIALQPDGKIVVAGRTFEVARLNPDGSPDLSFNGSGYAKATIAAALSLGMALQSDGKIVLAGGNDSSFILARFTAAGTPDSSFGLDGIVRTGVGLRAAAGDVAIQPDGKLLAVGGTLVSQGVSAPGAALSGTCEHERTLCATRTTCFARFERVEEGPNGPG